jgi:phage I-like protein
MKSKRIMIVPKGEYPHPSGLTQIIDDKSIASMAQAFNPGTKILFDFDHYSDLSNDQRAAVQAAGIQLPSDAAGWIHALSAGADGLYADVEWTPAGAAALANRTYRFRSPVFRRKDVEIVSEGTVRPLVLSKVGLTNMPNMRSMPALANAEADTDRFEGPQVDNMANSNATENFEENLMNYKSLLLKLLGLSDDASDAQIESKISDKTSADSAMANRITELEAANGTLENRATGAEAQVETFKTEALKVKVTKALEDHKDVITNREQIETALTKDFDGTLAILAGLKALPNREDGDLPPDGTEANKGEVKPTGINRTIAAFKTK